MTREERAMLLLEQEETTLAIAKLRTMLTRTADFMAVLASQLKNNPEKVLFSNAPDGLGKTPEPLLHDHLLHVQGVEWQVALKYLDVHCIAQTIQDLREAEARLSDVQWRLS